MKAPGAAALGVITPLALVLGFFMPDLACFVQDNTTPALDRFDTSPVRLNVASPDDATDALLLLAHGYTAVSLDNSATEGKEKARKAAQEALSFFYERGFDELDPSLYTSREEKPLLATSVSGDRAAKLWLCSYSSESNRDVWVSLVIDEASGKAVKITSSHADNGAIGTDESALAEKACTWAVTWADHLGFEHAAPIVDRESSAAVSDDENATFVATQPAGGIAVTLQGSDVDLSVALAACAEGGLGTMRAEPLKQG